jgi:hypothetical protein
MEINVTVAKDTVVGVLHISKICRGAMRLWLTFIVFGGHADS